MININHNIQLVNIYETTSYITPTQLENKSTTTHNSNPLKYSGETKVNISSEARAKLAQEQSEVGKTLGEQLKAQQADNEASEEATDVERLNKLIKEIQEQIKEVQEQIRALNGDKSETAQAKRKALDGQLNSLNATLIALLGKKLDAIE